jgi:predicted RNase H-like HicB family nuclease
MRVVRVRYHREPEGWWAETGELPNYSAAGATYEEVRDLVFRGLPALLDEPLDIREDLSEMGITVPVVVLNSSSTLPELHLGSLSASFAATLNRGLSQPLISLARSLREGTVGIIDRNERLTLT